MPSTGKAVAAVALLVVCVTLCSHQADGACTAEQKDEILKKCVMYLVSPWLPVGVPPVYTTCCCNSVKKVPDMDMECILKICTKADKSSILPESLLKLKGHCSIWDTTHPSPPGGHRPSVCSHVGA